MAVVDVQHVEVEQDVVFGRGGSRDLLCDIYRPTRELTKHTAVIHLHGGGFRVGSKAASRLARPLAGLGYTSISASYRLVDEALWPAQIHDTKACIRWARANADRLGVEANRVVVLGYSAGARLALIASGTQNDPQVEGDGGQAGVSTDVAACVAFYPPVGKRASEGRVLHPVLGPNPAEADYHSFSPIDQVKPGFPPTMLLHGTADETVPVEDSLRLYDALRGVKAAVELHVIDGMTHVFDAHEDIAQASALWIDLFLDRHVVNPRTYASTEPRR